jgi:hypothetical protein
MLKRYYRINEAADFLSAEHGERVSKRDVLEMGGRGDIRLCLWFSGAVCEFEEIDPFDKPIPWGKPHSFRGYIQIPRAWISPDGGDVSFNATKFIELVFSPTGDPMPPSVKYPSFYGAYDCDPATGFLTHVPFSGSCDDALIPAVDLLALSSASRANEKPLAVNLRDDSLLAVIAALLAQWPSGRPPTGKDLEKAAQAIGLNISDDTIRKALKAARDLAPSLSA